MAEKVAEKENDSKEEKESEKKEVKSSSAGYYFVIVILIIIAVVLGYLYYQNSSQATQLQNQVSQLKQDNSNLTSQVTLYDSQINSIKEASKTILVGNVAFWQANGDGMVIGKVPVSSFGAKNIAIAALNSNVTVGDVKNSGHMWNVTYCDVSNNCGNVIVDDDTLTYSIQ